MHLTWTVTLETSVLRLSLKKALVECKRSSADLLFSV